MRPLTRSAFLAATLITVPLWGDAASESTAPLTAAGLVHAGNTYLLPADAHLTDRLKELAVGERQFQVYAAQRGAIEADIAQSQDKLTTLRNDYRSQITLRDNTEDEAARNRVVSKINADLDRIGEGEKYIAKRRSDIVALKQPPDFTRQTIDCVDGIESATGRYDELSRDSSITKSLNAIHAHLGPTQLFKQQLPRLRLMRDKAMASSVPVNVAGGIPMVFAAINNRVVVTMSLDETADLVVIPASIATAAGISSNAGEPLLHLKWSDGGDLIGQPSTASQIQVGAFTLKNVKCLVQPPGTDESEGCVLGGSFLKNFLPRIDVQSNTLNLLPLAGDLATRTPSKILPTTAPSPTTEPAQDGAFTLDLSGIIDGGDSLRISADGLSLSHNYAAWPTAVRVNGILWNPQTHPSIAAVNGFEWLHQIDFASANVLKRQGRGQVEVKADTSAASLSLSDPEEGTDHYAVTLTFSPPRPPVAIAATQPTTGPTSLPVQADEFGLTLAAVIDSRDEFVINHDGIQLPKPVGRMPANVTVNDVAWDVSAAKSLPPNDSLEPLSHIDLASVRTVSQSGRGTFAVSTAEDGVHVLIVDGHRGAGLHTITLAFHSH